MHSLTHLFVVKFWQWCHIFPKHTSEHKANISDGLKLFSKHIAHLKSSNTYNLSCLFGFFGGQHLHTHTQTHTHTHKHIYTLEHTCLQHTHSNTHMHTHTCAHTHTHTWTIFVERIIILYSADVCMVNIWICNWWGLLYRCKQSCKERDIFFK